MKKFALLGIGGAGCNLLTFISSDKIELKKIAIITDKDSLRSLTTIRDKVIIKSDISDRKSVAKSLETHWFAIKKSIKDSEEICLVAGLGGKTGSFITPELLHQFQSMGKTVWVIVVIPFEFERNKRKQLASETLKLLQQSELLFIFKNENILASISDDDSVLDVFKKANEIIQYTLLNHIMDFRDIKETEHKQGIVNIEYERV